MITLHPRRGALFGSTLLLLAMAGCSMMSPSTQPAAATQPAASAKDDRPTIRVDAGADAAVTDSQGVQWQADNGYEGGEPVDRPELQITGTKTPELYRTERYSMDSYSFKVPNGKYVLKLHFSEDYEGISDPAERLFTYAVKDGDAASGKLIKEVKDFSPWKAAGDRAKAYIDSVPINVTNGKITISFTPQVENPQVNAIEIIPK